MSKSVIVTMYFNLKDLNDTSTETRPVDFYLKNGRGTLRLENPMVIFCDSITQPLIQAIRNEYVDPELCPTVYVVKNFTDYDYYNQLWPILVENRKRSRYYKNPGDRNTPSYYLAVMFKFTAMNIAHQRNDFDATHYFWIDFGYSHIVRGNMIEDARAALSNPKEKISVIYIHYRKPEEIQNLEDFCGQGSCGIATGVFSVEKDYVSKLYSGVWAIFYELLLKGCGHADEQVMTICNNRHPEMFTLSYGDYYSLLSNYHYVREDWNTVKWHFIKNALSAGKNDIAIHAAKNMLESISLGLLSMPEDEKKFTEFVARLK